jgi:hypothetical protein
MSDGCGLFVDADKSCPWPMPRSWIVRCLGRGLNEDADCLRTWAIQARVL